MIEQRENRRKKGESGDEDARIETLIVGRQTIISDLNDDIVKEETQKVEIKTKIEEHKQVIMKQRDTDELVTPTDEEKIAAETPIEKESA